MATLARWCFKHRYLVFAVWLCALLGTFMGSAAVGTAWSESFELPGTESSRAAEKLAKEFPQAAGDAGTVVWRVPEGDTVRQPAVRDEMTAVLADISKLPGVADVAGPYGPEGGARIGENGRVAYADVTFTKQAEDLEEAQVQRVLDTAQAAAGDGLEVELGGSAVEAAEGESPGGTAEIVGMTVAAVILFLVFGSFFSMLLPLACAVFGIGTGLGVIGLLTHVVSLAESAELMATLIGLGVAVDYALFIVTRHRSGLRHGMTPEESAVRAVNTAGRAVLFAGGTVCIALLGMTTLGLTILNGIAVGASVTVLMGVLAAVTLLPAMLGMLGTRVLSRRQRRRLAEHGPEREQTKAASGWARWTMLVQRRPRALAALALAVMIVIALPVFSLRLGTTDQGNNPESSTTRQAYDMLAEGFGPGFNGPLQLVAETDGGADRARAALEELTAEVRAAEGVAQVSPPQSPSPDAHIAVVRVVPETSPQSAETGELIERLRGETIPAAEESAAVVQVSVTGEVAGNKDFAGVITGKLPVFIAVIVVLGCLLMLLAFRSVLIPLTAAVMNLLAAGATFGLMVAAFQWGWVSDLLGLGDQVPITSFLPAVMLAMLFGLSMDYQVFLVSRMHEEWVHTRDNARAIRVGLTETGRVVTSAALIMIAVFSAFVLSDDLEGVMVGLGLAVAVALDAFVLRMMLVPAVMSLIGRANWWLPRRLEARLPHLAVEPRQDAERPAAVPVQQAVAAPTPAPVPVAVGGADTGGGAGAGAGAGAGISGPEAEVHGTVRDAHHVPVPGAVLTLLTASGGELARARSADDGSYRVAVPPEGGDSCILVATSPGLGAAKSTGVRLTPGAARHRVDLRLD